MPSCDSHCPFLNREDRRCSEHFQVTDLQHAFTYCFGSYKACPSYLEMLVERRVRRIQAHATQSYVSLTIGGRSDLAAHQSPAAAA